MWLFLCSVLSCLGVVVVGERGFVVCLVGVDVVVVVLSSVVVCGVVVIGVEVLFVVVLVTVVIVC